ncbi:hypothetical protein [Lysinibacter sp. HNR]|uniref:hypothetical protein n=1 Tax=Lysinibacter sp. HNR TaxID=3031408 RepID=UPI0024349AAF|nr:hypothetical protein [Lysinibacter sp. HNR]WGD36433.1 hypothetical protein FrondiHNR_08065 [Lysinibacter sp. HNR]
MTTDQEQQKPQLKVPLKWARIRFLVGCLLGYQSILLPILASRPDIFTVAYTSFVIAVGSLIIALFASLLMTWPFRWINSFHLVIQPFFFGLIGGSFFLLALGTLSYFLEGASSASVTVYLLFYPSLTFFVGGIFCSLFTRFRPIFVVAVILVSAVFITSLSLWIILTTVFHQT